MSISWWRSWHGAPTDHKWAVIAARASVKVGIVSAVAWALMDHASQHKERGTVSDFDTEVYAVYSGFDEAEIVAVIKAMNDKGIIKDGMLTNWTKRQPQREDDSRERVNKWRAMQRNVTQGNSEISADADKDKDKEVDKEKEEDAEIQPDSGGGYNPKSPFRTLYDAFLDTSGCKESLINPMRAADAINLWLKESITVGDVTQAIKEMQAKDMSIVGPWSITNGINIVRSKGAGKARADKATPEARRKYAEWGAGK